jgi:hypothetical protein
MITLSVQLWAFPGRVDDRVRFEDAVLLLLADHCGSVLSRVQAAEPETDQLNCM